MLTSSCLIFVLLLMPHPLLPHSISLVPEPAQINPIKHIIEGAIMERPPETLLLLNRQQNENCNWMDLHQLDIPIVLLDELAAFHVKDFFNSNVITVVCMSELADLMLLPVLAKDLHRMRDVRVFIWLQNTPTDPKFFLDMICEHASHANYLNLMVLNSVNESIVAYRLLPFPTPKLLRIKDIKKGRIFPILWRNLQNKTAVAVPSLYPPASYYHLDKRTGQNYLSGFMDRLIMEFAKKYNISLKMQRALNRTDFVYDSDIVQMTLRGEIDLSMHGRFWRPDVESSTAIGNSNLFIVVPCGNVMGLNNVYQSLKNYFLIVLCVYLGFSVVETLLVAATCRIFGRRYRFSWASLFVNLNSFRWVLGLPINVNRNRRSTSLHQIIMIMSIFSLIITCFFNANLSTLFTKRPADHHITNFQELEDSNLPIIFDNVFRSFSKDDLIAKHLNVDEKRGVFVSSHERLQLFFAQNCSYAYQMVSKVWDYFDRYQKYYNRKTLCKHKALSIYEAFSLHVILRNNSIYRTPLNDFISWSHDLGFIQHWTDQSIQTLMDFSNRGRSPWHPAPLNYMNLQWVWRLIAIFYVIAILIFIAELCINYMLRKRAPRVAFDV
ncbi:hypothetical protein KR044_010682 [Drosophila immigrans]|nr:hypothetical protein KR044_010682 [Drosophila immigrans]